MATNEQPKKTGRPLKSVQEKSIRMIRRMIPDEKLQAIVNKLADDCLSEKPSVSLKAQQILWKCVVPYICGKPEQHHTVEGSIDHGGQVKVYLPSNGRETTPARESLLGYMEGTNGSGNGHANGNGNGVN
jgi:hypothetical protein